MKSRRTPEFHEMFSKLPPDVQKQARKQYRLFQQNPQHQSLRFKPLHHPTEKIYSIRISKGYRTLAYIEDDTYVWFWIGSHTGYDKEI